MSDILAQLSVLERQGEDNIWRTAKAAKEEIAKLREQLALVAPLGVIACAGCGTPTPVEEEGVDHICPACTMAALQKRAEAAEAKLKAASDQEPSSTISEVIVRGGYENQSDGSSKFVADLYHEAIVYFKKPVRQGDKVYTTPTMPADVQELERGIDRLVARNIQLSQAIERWEAADSERHLEIAELERKLADAQTSIEWWMKGAAYTENAKAQAREEGRKEAVPYDFLKFLNGEQDLEGVWFGEQHPTKRGAFWWREYLHPMLAAAPEVKP